MVFVSLMCTMCRPAYTVTLNAWFLYDVEFNSSKSANVIEVAPEVIWRHIKSSGLLRGHLSQYSVKNGFGCSLAGVKHMMRDFKVDTVNNVHGFIGPICSYMCDVTGMISSSYSIPQVCSCIHLIRTLILRYSSITLLKFGFNILWRWTVIFSADWLFL